MLCSPLKVKLVDPLFLFELTTKKSKPPTERKLIRSRAVVNLAVAVHTTKGKTTQKSITIDNKNKAKPIFKAGHKYESKHHTEVFILVLCLILSIYLSLSFFLGITNQ